MSCCGKQRAALRQQNTTGGVYAPSAFVPRAMEFEYSGSAQLSVTGPLTGAVYRFRGRGARVRVDGADAASLVSVPGLKPVR